MTYQIHDLRIDCHLPALCPGEGRCLAGGGARVLALALMLFLAACTAPVRVEWTTETELDTAGFNVYRGASPAGPFDVKINAGLIPPAADPLVGGRYAVMDMEARAGRRYYYQLHEVERSGQVNTFGPVEATASWAPPWAPAAASVLACLAAGLLYFRWRQRL